MISEALMVTSWDLWAHDSGVKQPLKIFFLQEGQRKRRGYSPKEYLCKREAVKAGREYRKAYKQIRGSEYVRAPVWLMHVLTASLYGEGKQSQDSPSELSPQAARARGRGWGLARALAPSPGAATAGGDGTRARATAAWWSGRSIGGDRYAAGLHALTSELSCRFGAWRQQRMSHPG